MKAVGAVTVGQSPRDDVLPEIAALLPHGSRIIERGALDGISPRDLAALAPVPGEDLLVTRLRDGSEVRVSETRLLPRLQEAVGHVCERGARTVAILCTASLGGIRCPVPLVYPEAVVRNAVSAAVSAAAAGGRLAVVVPAADQAGAARAHWAGAAPSVHVIAASPYGPVDALRHAGETLAGWRPSLVLLDCLGFSQRMRQLFTDVARAPVILPRAVLAEAIAARLQAPAPAAPAPAAPAPAAGSHQSSLAQRSHRDRRG